ncbi:MAG TPA: asparagine synthase (glutamine-hydrolyzing) [Candidatus Nanoarchaeia archaeon]|nr:asparagine synthase (glutamine-hydrolyzing) [Candidatus Nanoarchaeia archaeon]
MCGIIGFNWNDKKLIKKMGSLTSYRGPDAFGMYTDSFVSLGQNRLAIVDLSENGKQPMFNENKRVVVVFNGEIWSYKGLREDLIKKGHKFKGESDTEVIVHGYEEYGAEIFSMLDGMFAIALYDKKQKKIFLARDKIGKRPLYYYFKKNKLIFASEIKAILEHGIVKREINEQCLSDYLSLRFSPSQETMIKDIFKVEPGSYIEYSRGKLSLNKYWDLPSFTPKHTPNLQEVDELIKKAVEKRLIGDVPIGILLSGGLDSSAIVSYFSKLGYKPRTFSVGFGDVTDETKYAEMVAKKYNTIHKTINLDKNVLSYLPEVVWHADEPLADPAILPTYVLCKEVAKEVKVAFSGEGGDEVFGGYADYNFLYSLEKIHKIPMPLRKITALFTENISKLLKYPLKQKALLLTEILRNPDFSSNHKKLLYLPFEEEDKRKLLSEEISSKVNLKNPVDEYLNKDGSARDNIVKYYFKQWLPNDLLMKADKAGLGNGLELRNPFLDYKLIDYFFHIEDKYKKERKLFREVVSRELPQEIMNKKKQGFVLPISNWFMEENVLVKIRPHFEDLMKRNFFKKEEIQRILDNPGEFRNDHRLWVLLNFEIWAKLYLDGVKKEDIKI